MPTWWSFWQAHTGQASASPPPGAHARTARAIAAAAAERTLPAVHPDPEYRVGQTAPIRAGATSELGSPLPHHLYCRQSGCVCS